MTVAMNVSYLYNVHTNTKGNYVANTMKLKEMNHNKELKLPLQCFCNIEQYVFKFLVV